MDIQCLLERDGAKLAVFESKRENDCVTKYLIEEYEDVPGQNYAIGTAFMDRFFSLTKLILWFRSES